MSSGENDDIALSRTRSKKRRVQRACDVCRRRKIRCDGSRMPGSRCTTCSTNDFECTYAEVGKKRRATTEYVKSLENRVELMERHFSKTFPGVDISEQLLPEAVNGDARTTNDAAHSFSLSTLTTQTLGRAADISSGHQTPSPEDPVSSDEEVDLLDLNLIKSIRKMAINPARHRFFGKSSGFTLIQHALDLKNEHTGDQAENLFDIYYRKQPKFIAPHLREIQGKNVEEPPYTFPEPDLTRKLIDLYFTYTNPIAPLLHRPTFERKYADGLHFRDSAFGAVVLLVCAVASPGCEDSRVLLPGTNTEHSAGWQYFEQAQVTRKTLLGPPCLEDLQVYCLAAIFLQGTSTPQACWTIVGIGIRLAQDVGAHRRKVYNRKLTVEDELWKRAFWIMVGLDRSISSALGRPCAIQDTDFDLDLPVVCDDKYWEHPDSEQAFKQPPGKPSYVAFFVSILKLSQILAFALRTIYSINKSKVLLGFIGQKWEHHIVAELDSALNKWIDSVPDHLRWDPNISNNTFLLQSCTLYAVYYHTQILIHRPYIPSPRNPSPLSYPSLAICTTAARSCSHVIDGYVRRVGTDRPPLHMGLQTATLTAGIVLLVNIWGGKKSGLAIDSEKEMADVHKCMAALKHCEKRYPFAGKFWDLLYELASVGDLPLPQAKPAGVSKRAREGDVPPAASVPQAGHPESQWPHSIAGSRHVTPDSNTYMQSRSQDIQAAPASFTQPAPMAHSRTQQPQQQRQQIPQLPVYETSVGTIASQFSQPPQSQHALPFADLGDPSSIMMALNNSNAGGISEIGSSRPEISNAGASTSAGAAPHVPYGTDDFLFHLMQARGSPFSQQQQASTNVAASAVAHGSEDTSMEGLMASLQPDASGQYQGRVGDGLQSGVEIDGMMDTDTTAMWSAAPSGFGLDDWSLYLNSVSGMNYDGGIRLQQQRQDYDP